VLRALLVLAGIGVTVYALIDCLRTDDRDVRVFPRPVWVLVILVVVLLGPLAWLATGRDRGAPSTGGGVARGPVAPDDDPEFLRRLGRSRRHPDDDPDGPEDGQRRR
jgi:hypothetical protein